MRSVLVTGSSGFIGKNLIEALRLQTGIQINCFDVDTPAEMLDTYLAQADVVYHLAGVNRPTREEEFESGNAGLVQHIVDKLRYHGRRPLVVLSSSVQAELDNPYGVSKKKAEEILSGFGRETGAPVRIFRLPNVFGKWCRPDYNSAVATFCHHIANGLPIMVTDPGRLMKLVYVDDVVRLFVELLRGSADGGGPMNSPVEPVYEATLGEIVRRIQQFKMSRQSLVIPDFADPFNRALYATYLTYLPSNQFAFDLLKRTDDRGSLAEVIKSSHFGQLFVSRTKPGITRGNHFHNTKVEKFCVVEGDAIIRFRHIHGDDIIEYPVSGEEFKVVDIPPGYAHSIENVGSSELVVLFWSDEIFNPNTPDTYPAKVIR